MKTHIIPGPHDVELIIKFKDGNIIKNIISWEVISGLKTLHNVNAIGNIYKDTIKNLENLQNKYE